MRVFRRLRKARHQAFAREVLPHLDTLYRFGLALTRDLSDADDLVQETFLKALQAFGSYQPGTNCRAWLLKIMRNTYINWVRLKGRETYLEDIGRSVEMFAAAGIGRTVAARPAGPETQVLLMSTKKQLLEALDSLPTDYRSAVVLVDVEGLSYKESAEVMDVPIGTVMSRLYRGRRLLRRRLVEMGVRAPADEEGEKPGTNVVLNFRRGQVKMVEDRDGVQDD